MNIEQKILEALKSAPRLSVSELNSNANLGERTYVSRTLAQMAKEGKITREKSGREVFYSLKNTLIALEENLNLRGLAEDQVWQRAIENPDFKSLLSENTENILFFAFTEMLNNAIDHSRSNLGYVKIWQEENNFHFLVEDKGIGIFRNFLAKKHLPSVEVAIGELVKGKQTTAPHRHSGEGIFWTSKIADKLVITSYDYQLIFNNSIKDYAIKPLDSSDFFLGTRIFFTISRDTSKSLGAIFEKYSLNNSTFTFDTTSIPVKLFESGDVWISRSQAKRILSGLENYQKIIFDFAGIEIAGQGFIDEIFSVFHRAHPNITLEAINTTKTLDILISRALHDPTGN